MTNKFKRHVLKALAISTIAVSSLVAPAIAEPTELLFNVFIPRPAPLYKNALEPWARAVEEASNGTLKITIPAASLAPPKKQYDIVQDGVADIAATSLQFNRKRLHLDLIGTLPLIAGSAQGASVAAWETHQKFFAEQDQWKEFKLLTLFSLGEPAILSSGDAVTSEADLKGFKVLAAGKDKVSTWKNLGASPVGSDGRKPFEMVSSGVADGATIPLGTGVNQGLIPITKQVTLVPGGMGGRAIFGLFMNRDRFEGLSAEAQNALTETSGAVLARKIGGIMDKIDNSGLKKFEAKGVTINRASPEFVEAIGEAGKFINENWLAVAQKSGVDGEAALEYFKEVSAGEKSQ